MIKKKKSLIFEEEETRKTDFFSFLNFVCFEYGTFFRFEYFVF